MFLLLPLPHTPTQSLYGGTNCPNADLTVSDLWVAVSVGSQDAPERCDAGGVLEGGMVRQRAMEVPLNLVCGQVAPAH